MLDKAAAVLFRKAAERGHAAAQLNLGCFEHGRGVDQSDSEAMKWYRKAAEQNNANAQFNLGICLRQGKGVHRHEKAAVACFQQAAEQGLAQFNFGVCLKLQGIDKNLPAAVEWFRSGGTRRRWRAVQSRRLSRARGRLRAERATRWIRGGNVNKEGK